MTGETKLLNDVSLKLKPARRERLADVLYGQILEQITSGQLVEGAKLPSEARICSDFQVSRPVVREALMRLQADGLVVSRQGIGTFVKSRPSNKLTDFAASAEIASYLRAFEPRLALETECAGLAAMRRTKAQLNQIGEALAALESAFQRGENGWEEDFAFHLAVAAAAGNELFPRLLQDLRDIMSGSMRMALSLTQQGSEDRRRRVLEEHRKIFVAISSQNADLARLHMRYHLTESRARVTGSYGEL
ncbi:GntR family transcriptional regulator [Sinorhizobium fredii USDA 205]|uniref:FCD domain-containing protein n=1 Tax=Rhizobium fredii TaxID=380 RepID=A0A844AAT3_RHIFR|nr:putative D-glucarate or D-galactorate regulator, GntR family [Sinorhizobium fredii CCBAU 83666]KSV86805.1 GntR family transcriptional regulator [Sinorhizobium fredii USDA 205]MQX10073.1 FCD domain-containing protein [Sinorhizobium fredii]GEC32385.1 GntR family transcriptional regulator [Sinorhizobium fredii]GLS08890.1 GntR family transcriptional regulator [Sinorhizobium fredii]